MGSHCTSLLSKKRFSRIIKKRCIENPWYEGAIEGESSIIQRQHKFVETSGNVAQ